VSAPAEISESAIEQIVEAALSACAAAGSPDELKTQRSEHLGERAAISQLNAGIKDLAR